MFCKHTTVGGFLSTFLSSRVQSKIKDGCFDHLSVRLFSQHISMRGLFINVKEQEGQAQTTSWQREVVQRGTSSIMAE